MAKRGKRGGQRWIKRQSAAAPQALMDEDCVQTLWKKARIADDDNMTLNDSVYFHAPRVTNQCRSRPYMYGLLSLSLAGHMRSMQEARWAASPICK